MEDQRQLDSVAVNEIQGDTLVEDVFLVSKSYLIERDERELRLLQSIEELKIKEGK